MIRWIGALLVTAGGLLLGMTKAAELRRRERMLGALVTAIESFGNEICLRLTPMPELAAKMALDAPEPVTGLFTALEAGLDEIGQKSLCRIWTEAVDASGLELKREERAALTELGQTLGRFSAAEQSGPLERCVGKLEEIRLDAAHESRTMCRLWTGLGITGGMLLAVLLL